MRLLCPLLVSAAILSGLLPDVSLGAVAVEVIHWEGVYRADGGANSTPLNLGSPTQTTIPGTGGAADQYRQVWLRTGAVPLSPASNYVVPSGRSGVFYGILQNTVIGGSGYKDISVAEITHQTGSNPAQSRFYIKNDSASEQSTIQGLIFFKKEDFLSGSAEQTVQLGPESSFAFASTTTMPGGTRGLRIALLNDGQWYLSTHLFTNSASFLSPYSNPAGDLWALWDPTEGYLPDIAASELEFLKPGSELTNIQAVGFTFISGPGSSPYLNQLASFTATLNVIPEGRISLLMGAGGAVALLGVLRRRSLATRSFR